MKTKPQDGENHVIIAVGSIIMGNNISERREGGNDQASLKAARPVSQQPPDQPSIVPASKQAKEQPAPCWKKVAGKAVGTLLLAWLVWLIFGREREQA